MHKIRAPCSEYLKLLEGNRPKAGGFVSGDPDSCHEFLPRPRCVHRAAGEILPQILAAKTGRRADPDLGARLLDRRRSLLHRDLPAGASGLIALRRRQSRSSAPISTRRSIEKARAGVYSEDALRQVSPQRLRRFFTRVNGHYQVNAAMRELCVFARHDLTKDPPFSKLDLISCRNVLIYLEPLLAEESAGHLSLRA